MDGSAGARRPDRILLVDDEADIRDCIKAVLETSLTDVEVETARDAEEGLRHLAARRFDLVISDYSMPGIDGIEFLLAVGRQAPSVPKVLMTAFPDLDMALEAINEAKVSQLLTKPLDPARLLATVEGILSAQRDRVNRERAIARSMATKRDRHTGR